MILFVLPQKAIRHAACSSYCVFPESPPLHSMSMQLFNCIHLRAIQLGVVGGEVSHVGMGALCEDRFTDLLATIFHKLLS